MAATTALAVILALRHGPPIALLGMVGGFLTPALITSGDPSAFLFFTYLYFVFAALMIVIRRQGWWLMTFPALLFAFGWVLAWIFSGQMKSGESLWMGLFLVAVAGTIVGASRQRYVQETEAVQSWRGLFSWRNQALALNVVSLAGAMALMATLAFNATFGLHDWVLFGTLAVGAVALAFFDTQALWLRALGGDGDQCRYAGGLVSRQRARIHCRADGVRRALCHERLSAGFQRSVPGALGGAVSLYRAWLFPARLFPPYARRAAGPRTDRDRCAALA